MKTHTKTLLTALTASAMLAGSANAAVITPTTTYGFTTAGLSALTDKSGTDGSGGVSSSDDPSTWDETGSGFAAMSFDTPLSSATNSKLGWYAFDLGSSQALGTIYVMNGYYLNNDERLSMDQYNIYYADTPTVSLSSGSDYDFSSGGWTQLGGLNTFSNDQNTAIATDASSISARYIGIEMIRKLNATDPRIGMNEFAVTAIPEPGSLALLGLGGLLVASRRRRA